MHRLSAFFTVCSFFLCAFAAIALPAQAVFRHHKISDFKGAPPIHITQNALSQPAGLTPSQVKTIYGLPTTGGKRTIAIIDAYGYPNAESDLNTFSQQFSLSSCTTKNGCFEKHQMATKLTTNTGWSEESSLDIEWAHAIAPSAKILLIEATTSSGNNLVNALNYAKSRSDVVAISMSWGGPEFDTESQNDSLFISNHALFFASAGDSGNGVEWPAVAANVIAVGGTTLTFDRSGAFLKEQSWDGSGGGLSQFEKQPTFQNLFGIPDAKGMRAVPDVAYNANPTSGYAVYNSQGRNKSHSWMVVGGTSAGAPQWAAISTLSKPFTLTTLYTDAKNSYASFFRDITSLTNGDCGYYCKARKGYDYVTGLGSPLTYKF